MQTQLTINSDCDDFELEEFTADGEMVLKQIKPDAQVMFISASNVNWQGMGGVAVQELPTEGLELWQAIAGIVGDWNIRVETIKRDYLKAMVSHHDAPTGGARHVFFMSPDDVYSHLRYQYDSRADADKDIGEALEDIGEKMPDDEEDLTNGQIINRIGDAQLVELMQEFIR